MRLFLAINVNKEITQELSKLQHAIQSHLSSVDKLLLVDPTKIHLTLKFFGEIEDDKLNNLITALKTVKMEKFSIETDKLNYFTNPNGRPRVVFLSFKKSKELTAVHTAVEEALKPLGIKKDDFKCHATLFRVKFLKDKYRLIEVLKHVKVTPLKLEISSMELFESKLLPSGPIHSLVEKFEL